MDLNNAISHVFDEELRQLTELRKMAENPRLFGLMRQLVAAVEGANGTTPKPQHNMSGGRELKAQDTLFSLKPTKSSRFLPNGLTDVATSTIKTLNKTFTTSTLVDAMEDTGYKFTSAKPRIAVAGVMKALIKRKQIRLIERGVGSMPHTYEFIGQEGVKN